MKSYHKDIGPKVPFLISLFRSQAASFVATAADFTVLIFLTEVLRVWYVGSTAVGAFVGACISFFLSRNWAFKRQAGNIYWQVLKYIMVSMSSLALNTYGVYFLTENFGIQYILSRAIVAIFVGLVFNFFLFRYFVFK